MSGNNQGESFILVFDDHCNWKRGNWSVDNVKAARKKKK